MGSFRTPVGTETTGQAKPPSGPYFDGVGKARPKASDSRAVVVHLEVWATLYSIEDCCNKTSCLTVVEKELKTKIASLLGYSHIEGR
jgi:hypothetical protein